MKINPPVWLWALTSLGASAILSAETRPLSRVESADLGVADDGGAVKIVTLRNAKGMTAEIITYGAIIKRLDAPDRDGRMTNVVLSTSTLKDYEHGFAGAAAVIGRVVNRIGGAQFELDGTVWKLPTNHGKHTIHGGNKGFAQRVWNLDGISSEEHSASVRLSYLSKDGEEGFPGNLKATVTYALSDDNELRLDYVAVTDKPTLINLTNHAYWNLSGGGPCIDDVLYIPSWRYTVNDDELIPTGEIRVLDGTPMDFRQPTRIGDRIDQLKPKLSGYDHNFILDGGHTMKLAARLTEPKSGRTMEVRTSQPAVQLYTGNHLGRTAVCLETQHYPDAIHHANFPTTVLRPGELWKESTIFTFSAK